MSKRNAGVTELNLTTFVYDVATFNALLTCLSAFRYTEAFTIVIILIYGRK